MEILLNALINTLSWVTGCEDHEPATISEAALHIVSCLLRIVVFALGTYVIVDAALKLAGMT